MNFSGLGAGTIGDPYQISTVTQLHELNGFGIGSPVQTAGSGLNDIVSSGQYSSVGTNTYTVRITSAAGVNGKGISASGTGYAVNDTFTIDGGVAGALCLCTVSAVSGGQVTAFNVTTRGSGYTVSSGRSTTNVIGSGSGLKVNITSLTSDYFKWKKNSGVESAEQTMSTTDFALSDGVQVRFNATTGHTYNDQWVVTVNPVAYFKLVNNIDLGSNEGSVLSSIQFNNFYGSLDGDNKTISGIVLGRQYYGGFALRDGCVIKNVTFRPTKMLNNNEFNKESTIIKNDLAALNNVTLSNIKVITSGTVKMLYFTNQTFNATCTINNIVLEGDLQGAFIGTVKGVIEHVKLLRVSNFSIASTQATYLPLVSNLQGTMQYCQHIILGLDITISNGSIGFLVGTLGSTGKVYESFVYGNVKVTYSVLGEYVTVGLIGSGQSTTTQEVKDCYFKGVLDVNGGEITPGANVNRGKSGFIITTNSSINIDRCYADVNIISPNNDNRPVFTRSDSVKITNCYYKKSTLTSITATDVATRQIGLTDAQALDTANYNTFDFATIWQMTASDINLRNNPLYTFETELISCEISTLSRLSSSTFRIGITPKFSSSYGFEVYQNNILLTTQNNVTSYDMTVPIEDKAYVIKSFYWDGGVKYYSDEETYNHYIYVMAISNPTYVTVAAESTLSGVYPANYVHGSILYNGYVYGVVRQQPFPTSHGVLVRAPEHNLAAFTTMPIKTNDTTPDGSYTTSDYSATMEQIVECGGYLYFVFLIGGVTFEGSYLCQYDPAANTYKVFRFDSRIRPYTAPLITDGIYLYFSDYVNDKVWKILASQFVGAFPKFNLTVGETWTIAGSYDASTQGNHIAGGYASALKGEVHSGLCDAEYLYVSYTTDHGDTSSGYYAPLDISVHEVHKIKKSDMTAAGFVKIPKSTDDMAQNATHLFYGIEVQPNADSRTYGYGWGGYAVRKSDMVVLGLPKYEATDDPPNITSYASLIFGDYLLDAKTNKTTYILDISDVDNWSINEPISKRVAAKYKYKKTDGTTDVSGVPNEFLLASDNTFYAYTFLVPSALLEFQLPGFNFFTEPTVTTMNLVINEGNHIFGGYIVNDGSQPILSRGFKYGTDMNNLDNTVLSLDTTPEFHATIPQLPAVYYYQAFATNSIGESTLQIKSFNSSGGAYRYKSYIIVSRVI